MLGQSVGFQLSETKLLLLVAHSFALSASFSCPQSSHPPLSPLPETRHRTSCWVSRDRNPHPVWVSTSLALGDRNKMFERSLAQMSFSSPPAMKITSPGTERGQTGQIQQEKGSCSPGRQQEPGKGRLG